MVAAVTEVLVDIALGMGSPAMALEVAILVVDGTEVAITGEDVAITHTGDMPIPTSVIILTIPIMPTDIGLLSAITMEGATGSGCLTIIDGNDAPKEVKVRHIGNCLKADPAYGKGVADALGIPLSDVPNRGVREQEASYAPCYQRGIEFNIEPTTAQGEVRP